MEQLDAALTALNAKDREIERLRSGIEKAAIALENVQMTRMAERFRKMADGHGMRHLTRSPEAARG